MKKILLVTILVLCVANIFSQEIKKNIVDDFTGGKVIETSWEKIYSGGASGKNQTRARFRHQNNTNFLEFRIFTNKVASCNKDTKVLLKTANGVIEGESIEYALSEPGAWNPSGINNKLGIYIIYLIDTSQLNNELIEKIRFNLNGGYIDIALSEKDSKKLLALYNVFVAEI